MRITHTSSSKNVELIPASRGSSLTRRSHFLSASHFRTLSNGVVWELYPLICSKFPRDILARQCQSYVHWNGERSTHFYYDTVEIDIGKPPPPLTVNHLAIVRTGIKPVIHVLQYVYTGYLQCVRVTQTLIYRIREPPTCFSVVPRPIDRGRSIGV